MTLPAGTAVRVPALVWSADRVVVGTDGSYWGDEALAWAARHAWARGAELEVWTPGELSLTPSDVPLVAGVTRASRAFPLLRIASRVTGAGPAADLANASIGSGLLVLGCRGHRRQALGLGRVVLPVVASARCDTVIVRGKPAAVHGHHRHITAMVSGGPYDEAVLRRTSDIAAAHRCDIAVVHAWPPPVRDRDPSAHDPDAVLDASAVRLAQLNPQACFTLRLDPCQPHESVSRITDTDLLVLGRGEPPHAGPGCGSITKLALHHSPCPVLVTPETTEPTAEGESRDQ